MSWILLFVAGIFEIAWAVGLKLHHQEPSPWLLFGTVLAFVGSVVMLAVSMKYLPLGTAYAIWTGIGTVGAFIVSIVWFREPINTLRIASVTLLVLGLIGLKMTSQ